MFVCVCFFNCASDFLTKRLKNKAECWPLFCCPLGRVCAGAWQVRGIIHIMQKSVCASDGRTENVKKNKTECWPFFGTMCPIVSPRMVNTKSDAMLAFVLFPSWQDLTRSLAGLGDTFQQAKICTAPPMFLSRAFQKTRRKAGPLWVLCLRCPHPTCGKNKTECRH